MPKRDWKKVNQKYIKRGEFLLNLRFLKTWTKEINKLNHNKVGEPYLYPNSLIEFLGYFHCRGFGYRECQGIIQSLSKLMFKFPVISYTQICRRLNKLNMEFEVTEKNLIVAVDGSGEKVSNRGEWMRQKWKVRRGWVKVIIMGTTDGKVVDIRVGNEKLDERKSARGMIRKNQSKIKCVMMDGLHDSKSTFNLCEKYNLETAIKVRKNSRTRSKGSPRRRKEVVKYKKLGHKEWVKKTGYGMRWPASEGIFSANKRIFGEDVRATKKRNMYQEIRLKFLYYNKLLEIT